MQLNQDFFQCINTTPIGQHTNEVQNRNNSDEAEAPLHLLVSGDEAV